MISRRILLRSLAAAAPPRQCAVVMRVHDGRLLRCDGERDADSLWLPPGSAVKPLTWLNLPDRSPLVCRGRLRLGSHLLDCSHLPLLTPVDEETALAASCNCWFAERARRLDAASFQHRLLQAGAKATPAHSVEELQLQALGVEGVRFTVKALATAYCRIAVAKSAALHRALERAVQEGTGQWAALPSLPVAGKTGTTRQGAWFAGFAPAAQPQVVVSVFVAGGSGGSDAAPVARELFAWWRRTESSR
jgi:cell division protein FtsI/penicillin-binding protein 2